MPSPAAPNPLVEVRAFGRRRPGGTAWLLRGISLCIEPGERLAVVGPTGSGKTLLLRSLALLDPWDAGQILWRGHSVSAAEVPAYRRQVTYLHQRPALFAGSVEENLRQPFGLRIHRDRRFDRDYLVSLLADVQREASFLSQPAGDLSGGERQIVALLRVLQLAPVVLLLDEPTAALDAETARMVETLVQHWFESERVARTVVWVSHNRDQVGRVADRVFTMRGGSLMEEPER